MFTLYDKKYRLFVSLVFACMLSIAGIKGYQFLKSSSIDITKTSNETPPAALSNEEEGNSFIHSLVVNKGDTLGVILQRVGIESSQASDAIRALNILYNVGNLTIGQTLSLVVKKENSHIFLEKLTLTTSPGSDIEVKRDSKNAFYAKLHEKKLYKRLVHIEGKIKQSLFHTASYFKIPSNIMVDVIQAYSYDIDFQRDIKNNAHFEVLFERFYNDEGEAVRDGKVIFASIDVKNRSWNLYRYMNTDKKESFYNEKGEHVVKSLLKTPVNGARLSSGFGMRKHPILGYSRKHEGVDFAAITGTPVMAAGEGLVVEAVFKKGYGNYLRIKHASGYETAYAHLSRFGQNIRKGSMVNQGQVVAFVGATGSMCTGAHLHFEVIHAGKRINPMNMKLIPHRKLEGAELKRFHDFKAKTAKHISSISSVSTHMKPENVQKI